MTACPIWIRYGSFGNKGAQNKGRRKRRDGAADLYDLFQLDQELGQKKRKVFQKYLPNYHINLVDAGDIHDTKVFHTDLQQIFGMLKSHF